MCGPGVKSNGQGALAPCGKDALPLCRSSEPRGQAPGTEHLRECDPSPTWASGLWAWTAATPPAAAGHCVRQFYNAECSVREEGERRGPPPARAHDSHALPHGQTRGGGDPRLVWCDHPPEVQREENRVGRPAATNTVHFPPGRRARGFVLLCRPTRGPRVPHSSHGALAAMGPLRPCGRRRRSAAAGSSWPSVRASG